MFYNACLCGGVEPLKAKTLYAAVYHFGPRWELRAIELGEGMPPRGPGGRRTKGGRTKGLTKGGVRPKGEMGGAMGGGGMGGGGRLNSNDIAMPIPSPEEAKALSEYVTQRDPSLSEIEKLDVSAIAIK